MQLLLTVRWWRVAKGVVFFNVYHSCECEKIISNVDIVNSYTNYTKHEVKPGGVATTMNAQWHNKQNNIILLSANHKQDLAAWFTSRFVFKQAQNENEVNNKHKWRTHTGRPITHLLYLDKVIMSPCTHGSLLAVVLRWPAFSNTSPHSREFETHGNPWYHLDLG